MYLPHSSPVVEEKSDELWDWYAVALFLLIPIDLLTTVGAALSVGIEEEINPLMRWFLTQELSFIVLIHLIVVFLAVYGFWGVILAARRTLDPTDRYLTFMIEIWLGLLISFGLFIFANNMSVIVLGGSLL